MGKLLNTKEAAEYLGFSPATLHFWRSKARTTGVSKGPKYVKLGPKSVRYDEEDLAQWVEQRRKDTREDTT